MDRSTVLTISSVAGAAYTAQTFLVPKMWLGAQSLETTDDNVFLTRAVGGGIAGLTALAYMGRTADSETQRVALCASATAFTAWAGNNVLRFGSRPSTQTKIDLGVCVGLLGLCVAGLVHKD